MIKKLVRHSIALLVIIIVSRPCVAQNSLLVNFGSASCGGGEPTFSLIKDPLKDSSSLLTSCSLANQLPDIFAVFIAYNPKNNKIYVADIRTGITKIWVLDLGLPANISCPPVIDTLPGYAYGYVSNNFEFDNNGNLWSFSNYNDTIGQCSIDQFDVNTGNIINTRRVQFPEGNFPNTISSGDFTILPNGRMFATLGSFPSRLYEITGYSSTTGNASATFLDTLPKACFGIAYLNGQLEITGTDFFDTCYYYKYDISSKILDSAKNFQNGQLPIDNTSITPSLGVTNQLVNASKINGNTADLTYEIYVRNLGNVALNNINVTDNLAAAFGPENISRITLAFDPGGNDANLMLNASYNGNTDTSLLIGSQNLANQTSVNTNYFLKMRLGVRVTNLNPAIYLNSAVGSATIGSEGALSFIDVSDSSNNGPQTMVDPNNNGNAGEPGENIPTPFNFATLPVHFISVSASLVNNTASMVQWSVATPAAGSDKFEVQCSADGATWTNIGMLKITDPGQSSYRFRHLNIPLGNLYYRIKEIDVDGAYVYSNVVLLHNKNISGGFTVFPNPAHQYISISPPYNVNGKTQIILYDATGRQLLSLRNGGTVEIINTTGFTDGSYVLKIINNDEVITRKVLILHSK